LLLLISYEDAVSAEAHFLESNKKRPTICRLDMI